MTMQFPEFEPTGQPAGDACLARFAEEIAPMSPRDRFAWLAEAVDEFRERPVTEGLNALTKSQVLATLERWLAQLPVMESA